ncbi:NifB/NifX family molybdenum-iron cluster-binding protein [[Clostridium] fimetarium]|uniref:Dinitrogenase iron-molybdenum cofactor n=1 Tax=[Clostridium] fimetarium TaxID=99656 RepID=A0A1I0PNU8_9FIRM|nr:NifB/NifX family molybdenum-iron cluster-binding protein [[Clostridium] fimetarium]SEW16097.1 Dinitrogenase iron-molybdenum cofactor [[Clostridium] fimetarium]
MSYKIAVASTDGIYLDAHFGGASSFLIYEVNADGSYENKEKRIVLGANEEISSSLNCSSNSDCAKKSSCTSSDENKNGSTGGCGGHSDSKIEANVALIADCRCLLCNKVGAGAERQLERKAITAFQVSYKIDDALAKIINYYTKIDNHISLRNAR